MPWGAFMSGALLRRPLHVLVERSLLLLWRGRHRAARTRRSVGVQSMTQSLLRGRATPVACMMVYPTVCTIARPGVARGGHPVTSLLLSQNTAAYTFARGGAGFFEGGLHNFLCVTF